MTKVVRVCVESDCELDLDLNLLSLGNSIAKIIRAGRGYCVPLWLNHSLVLTVQNATSNEVESLLAPFIESAKRHHHNINIVQKDAAELQAELLSENYSGPGAYRWQRLTKAFFCNLDSGVSVHSTLLNNEGRSIFSVCTGARENLRQRTGQWQLAQRVRAAYRNCIAIF